MLALGVVLGVMWLLAKWARKPLTGKSDRMMNVLARQQLSRGASVAVIKIADRALVLGVTEQSVQLLTEADLRSVESALEVVENPSPKRRLAALTSGPSRTAATAAAMTADEDIDYDIDYSDAPDSVEVALNARTSHRAAKPKTGRKGRRPASSTAAKPGALDGSILSPKVWKQLMQGARDLTVRR